jgi:hypothetical protein
MHPADRTPISRRALLRGLAAAAAAAALPPLLPACARAEERAQADAAPPPPATAPGDDLHHAPPSPEDLARLRAWVAEVRAAGLDVRDVPLGRAAARVGEAAAGTPYEPFTLEAYLRAGGSPMRTELLTLSLTEFDCVSLVEACLAVARVAERGGAPAWGAFAREMERLRYRGGERGGYASRLHYFSEWISDNAARGGMRDLGRELGGVADRRPLRFMTSHPESYPALAHPEALEAIAASERALDERPRWVVPTERIPAVADRIETGDVIAFATAIEGLDVTHAAFAYRDGGGVLRVLHAPLSGGVVEVTGSTLPQYVAAIRRSTGILVARPLRL